MLNIQTEVENRLLVIRFTQSLELDVDSVKAVLEELERNKPQFKNGLWDRIMFDLGQLGFMDSHGIEPVLQYIQQNAARSRIYIIDPPAGLLWSKAILKRITPLEIMVFEKEQDARDAIANVPRSPK